MTFRSQTPVIPTEAKKKRRAYPTWDRCLILMKSRQTNLQDKCNSSEVSNPK